MINIETIANKASQLELILAKFLELDLYLPLLPWMKEELIQNHQITIDNHRK